MFTPRSPRSLRYKHPAVERPSPASAGGMLAETEHVFGSGLCFPCHFKRILFPVLGPEDLDADHPVVTDLVKMQLHLFDRKDPRPGIQAVSVGETFLRKIFGVVDVKYE